MSASDAPKRRTVMDRIFDFPALYRAKISLVRLVTRPVSSVLIRNRFADDDIILDNVPDGASVFEVGCGDGNGFRLFAQAGRSVRYTGSDYNTHMVDYCRTHFPQASWEYYSGGAYTHADGEFDYCVIRHVLHHIPERSDIVQTIREAIRISKNVVLIEPLQSEGLPLRLLKSLYWKATDGGVNYMRLNELQQVWKDAGAEITWEVWTHPLRQTYACTMKRKT